VERLLFGRGSAPLKTSSGADLWSAGDALVGLVRKSTTPEERVQGDPRGPGGPPHLASSSTLVGRRPKVTPLRSRFGNNTQVTEL